ncbi:MAG: DUF4197 domain-containing protein [Sphingomonadaceae bacterium]|nr:DUF4197 domain-containing protein [Sphingomonadaceae bacterium]
MSDFANEFTRRAILAGIGAGALTLPFATNAAFAKGLGLSGILGKASDSALDKLSQPGAYYNDKSIRIGLPLVGKSGGLGGLLGGVMSGADKLGLLDGFTRTINDAAGAAAGEAKPIFRDSIDQLSFNDVPGLVKEDTGGTQYLRRTSNDRLHGKLEPLVDSALGDLGAHTQLERLNAKYSWLQAAGIDRAKLNRTVTDQGLDGIFQYMGVEEKAFRANPLGKASDIFKGIF